MNRASWPVEWAQISVSRRTREDAERMYDLLSRKYYCARCGRSDLPLALFFEHDKSCSFESAVGRSSLDMLDEIADLIDKIEQKDERIEKLEMTCRDGLNTIHWFERLLERYSVPYSGRDLSHMKSSIARALGPVGIGYHKDKYKSLFPAQEARCTRCQGLFDIQHMVTEVCKWCGLHTNEISGKVLP